MSAGVSIPSSRPPPAAPTSLRSEQQQQDPLLDPRDGAQLGIPRSESSSSRLEADLGPSLSSVLRSFDFSSSHASFQSSDFGLPRARSATTATDDDDDEDEDEQSSDSTNLTTNPSTPAFARDKEAGSTTTFQLGRFEAFTSAPPPPPAPVSAAAIDRSVTATVGINRGNGRGAPQSLARASTAHAGLSAPIATSTATAAAVAVAPSDSASIANLGAHFSPEPIGGPDDQIPDPGYWGTRRLLYPTQFGALGSPGSLDFAAGAPPFIPKVSTAPLAATTTNTPTAPATGVASPFRSARSLHGSTSGSISSSSTGSHFRLPPNRDVRSAAPVPSSQRLDPAVPRASRKDSTATSASGSVRRGSSDAGSLSTRNGRGGIGPQRNGASGSSTSTQEGAHHTRRAAAETESVSESELASAPSQSQTKRPQRGEGGARQPPVIVSAQLASAATAPRNQRQTGEAPQQVFRRLDLSESPSTVTRGLPPAADAPAIWHGTGDRDPSSGTMPAISRSPVDPRAEAIEMLDDRSFERPSHLRTDTIASSEYGSSSNPSSGTHTPAGSISALTAGPGRVERADSFLSTATDSTSYHAGVSKATIATIRRVDKADMAARPVRLHKLNGAARGANGGSSTEPSTDSTLVSNDEESSQHNADGADGRFGSAPSHAGHSHGATDSLWEAGHLSDSLPESSRLGKLLGVSDRLPRSAFSDTLSAPDSRSSSRSSSVGRAGAGVSASSFASNGVRTASPRNLPKALIPTDVASALSRSDRLSQASRSRSAAPSVLTVDVGLGIRGGAGTGMGGSSSPLSPSRPNLGLALGVVPEFSEVVVSPAPLSSASSYFDMRSNSGGRESGFEAGSSSGYSRRRGASVSTNVSLVEEPAWGQNRSVATSAPDPALDSLAAFAFPSPMMSSTSEMPTPTPGSAQLRSATLHSTNPSMQSTASTNNGWIPASVSQYSSVRAGAHSRALTNTTQLSTATRSHAPASSAGGSTFSMAGAAGSSTLNLLGLSQLAPSTRDEMLNRLLLDQARVDCQDYGLMGLEDVANAKRELKTLEGKIASMKVKLKVEAKIRDAAVALRKAHRRAPTGTLSPSSPNVGRGSVQGLTSPSLDGRSRGTGISVTETKAEEDAAAAMLKVDKVTRDLLKLNDRAQLLRRMVLEHQAAALVERVDALEADRAMIEERLPRLASSTSLASSLGRNGSISGASSSGNATGSGGGHRGTGHGSSISGGVGNVSAMTIRESRALTSEEILASQESDEPYRPHGPSYPLSHNRFTSAASAGSGFSFLDPGLREQAKELGSELERTKAELELVQQKLAATQREMGESTQRADAFRKELEDSQRDAKAAAAELLRVQGDMAALRSEKERFDSEANRLRTQLDQEQRNQADSQEALQLTLQQRLEAQRKDHEAQLADRLEAAARDAEQGFAKQVAEHEANARAAQQALQSHQTTLDQLRQELKEAQDTLARQRAVELSDQSAKQDVAVASAELAKAQKACSEAETLATQRAAELAKATSLHAAAEKLAAERATELQQVRDKHAAAERLLAERTTELQQANAARATAEKMASQRQAEIDTLSSAKAAADKLALDRAQELDRLRTAHSDVERRAADAGAKLSSEQRAIDALKAELEEERRQRAAAEAKIAAAQQQTRDAESRAAKSDAGLRELELAVGAERKIMAERDELFHAFERRLESAEKRLQEQDKRCARMLGKLDGREEMDDLLERIKAGAGGVTRKKKTAGQDIADLLGSLEMHIEDMADELARAGAGAGGSSSAGASPALRQMESDLDEAEQEAARWRTQAEGAKRELDELRTQHAAREAAQAEVQAAAAKEAAAAPVPPPGPDPKQLEELASRVEKLTSQNRELDRKLREARAVNPSGTTGAVAPGKGVGNLISKFGGGSVPASRNLGAGAPPRRSVSHSAADAASMTSNAEIDAETQRELREMQRTAAEMNKLVPEVEARPSVSLQALRMAFEAPLPTPPGGDGKDAEGAGEAGAAVTAADLRRELDVLSHKLRSAIGASRTAISQGLQAETDAEALQAQLRDATAKVDEYRHAADELHSKLSLSTAELEMLRERERRLEDALSELREQSEAGGARTRSSPASNSSSLPFAIESMPSFSPRRNAKTLVSLPPSSSSSSSPPTRRPPPLKPLLGNVPYSSSTWTGKRAKASSSSDKLDVNPGGSLLLGGTGLAPPPSPGLMLEGMSLASPTRSHASSLASPSPSRSPARPFVPPFASTLETRTGGKSPEPRLAGASGGALEISPALSNVSLPPLPPNSAPTTTKPGPRTITLGMDTASLMLKIRELERQLVAASAWERQSNEIKAQHEELRRRQLAWEEEKVRDAEMSGRLLEELNEANRLLALAKAAR